ncbi:RelA-associated inhibitor family [Trichomonas vaginalis G3]|uniref:RelA-associated inhibitor family n=1 Tax=Trichomonas vaginalis (strain ATCC PRA-98 / G3) TaxID=412133 RepID=UPI0021E5406B|nr:RelA-associated inhibitor family [Trichomonas vaginalis G3]KAI5550457.1 RelA-associated inhibitor family [Trichomonas vaginalis G3]
MLSNYEIDSKESAKHIASYIEDGTFFQIFDSIKITADILKYSKLGLREVDLLFKSGREQYNSNDLFRCFHKARVHVNNYEELKYIFTLFEEKLDFRSMREISHQFDKIMQENQKLTEQYNDLYNKAREYSKKCDELQQKLSQQQEYSKIISELKSQISSKESEIQKLQKQLKSKDNDIFTLKEQLSSKDSDFQSLKSQLSSSEKTVKSLKQQISANESTISQLREKDEESESLNSLQKCSKADGVENVHRIYTILSFAAQEGYMETIKHAVRYGYINVKCDIEQNNYRLLGMNGLIYAAYKGDLPLVKAFNKCDVDMKFRTKEGESIIHAFSISGNLEGLKYAENFLSINDVNEVDETALHCGVFFLRLAVIQYLANNSNVEKNIVSDSGTPIKCAINRSRIYLNLASYLDDHGCELTDKEKDELRSNNKSSSSSSDSDSEDSTDRAIDVLGKLLILNALLN